MKTSKICPLLCFLLLALGGPINAQDASKPERNLCAETAKRLDQRLERVSRENFKEGTAYKRKEFEQAATRVLAQLMSIKELEDHLYCLTAQSGQ